MISLVVVEKEMSRGFPHTQTDRQTDRHRYKLKETFYLSLSLSLSLMKANQRENFQKRKLNIHPDIFEKIPDHQSN